MFNIKQKIYGSAKISLRIYPFAPWLSYMLSGTEVLYSNKEKGNPPVADSS